MKTEPNDLARGATAQPAWFELVRDRVRGLRFGVVQIVIHDGRVTQVESTERVRLATETAAGHTHG
jgi:hypothetical protein